MKNYYGILGIPTGSDNDRVRKAYLEKVRTIHPDINPSPEAHQEFILVKEAYDTLSNENKRAVYDQQLKQAATTKEQVKNFHYDFESNLPKNHTTKNSGSKAIVLAVLIALLLAAGGAAFFFLTSSSK